MLSRSNVSNSLNETVFVLYRANSSGSAQNPATRRRSWNIERVETFSAGSSSLVGLSSTGIVFSFVRGLERRSGILFRRIDIGSSEWLYEDKVIVDGLHAGDVLGTHDHGLAIAVVEDDTTQLDHAVLHRQAH